MPTIIPAILTNDLEDYKHKLTAINELVTDLQIDITDGKFVPSKTIALKDIIDIPRKPKIEIHLMVYESERYFDDCLSVQAETILFHLEATDSPELVMKQARHKGLAVGVVLNPGTSLDVAVPLDDRVSIIQLMGVHPGFYGRPFIPQTLDRLRTLRSKITHAMLAVDGGINAENIVEVAATGVDRIVVGSGIFGRDDPALAYKKLRSLIG